MKKSKTIMPLMAAISMFLLACDSEVPKDDNTISPVDTMSISANREKSDKVFYAIPSPMELASIIKKSGALFNIAYLNPLSNANKYSTAGSKALNLGIYGCDLSYTSIFDKTQDAMNYMKCTKKLADGLGISGAFTPEMIGRMEKYIDNKDTLLQIVSDTYWATDSYLKENERSSTSALVIAGGWIEGLYIATRIASSSTANEELLTLIGDQKLTLDNLLGLIQNYPDDKNIKSVESSLMEMKSIYTEVQEKKEETVIKENKTSTTIGSGNATYKITPEQLAKISAKIETIRTDIIK